MTGWARFRGNYLGRNFVNMTYQAYQNLSRKLIYLDISYKSEVDTLILFLLYKKNLKFEKFHFQV